MKPLARWIKAVAARGLAAALYRLSHAAMWTAGKAGAWLFTLGRRLESWHVPIDLQTACDAVKTLSPHERRLALCLLRLSLRWGWIDQLPPLDRLPRADTPALGNDLLLLLYAPEIAEAFRPHVFPPAGEP
ncbi:MAG TPA: hypothetical protein VJ793_22415 [Anaerolineae bacterium]|nr:hypothetical protein [Anaerolineae bacterium]